MNKNHNYLVHYGVKGQKWGVRNYQNYDGSLTPLGREHYGVGQGRKKTKSVEDAKKDGLAATILVNVGIKLAIPIVASTAITLAAVGATAVDHIKAKSFNKKLHKEMETDPIDEKTGMRLKSREYTRKEDIAAVNPRRGEWSSKKNGAENNCMLCTSVYDLRRRGYNVTAGMAREGFTSEEIKRWYPKAKIVNLTKKVENNKKSDFGYRTMKPEEVQETLDKQGVGARGNLMLQWPFGGGHSVAYEVESDGKAHVYDTQLNKAFDSIDAYSSQMSGKFGGPIYTQFARLDNVEINQSTIKEVISESQNSDPIRGIQNG